jgi:hypothetical protein
MKLSKNLTLSEVSKSQTASRRNIDNTPTAAHIDNLKQVAEHIFQPVRDHFKKPIFVSSGYRSAQLNQAIGGAGTYESGRYIPKSQHCYGQALDLDNDAIGKPSNAEIFYHIYDNLDFDQLIWEYGDDDNPAWVHVSYKDGKNRKQVLRALKEGKRTIYQPFVDKR